MMPRGGGAIGIQVGDIIDLTNSSMVRFGSTYNLRAVIRSEKRFTMITVFAPEECGVYKVARVTNIKGVDVYARTNNKGARGKYAFTNVYVDLEDAYGERPTLIAENSIMTNAVAKRDDLDKEWNRPNFGGAENAKKEEN